MKSSFTAGKMFGDRQLNFLLIVNVLVVLVATWLSHGQFVDIDNLQSMVKTLSMGLTIALVGMYYGYKARGGPAGVGNAVARSMIVNLIMVHLLGAFWSQVFYSKGANYPFGG